MSKQTENLKLFQYEPGTDGNQTFNIDQALNENWAKIDAEMPGASTKAAPAGEDSVLLYDSEDQAAPGKPKKALLSKVADLFKGTFYTKPEVDTALSNKAPAGYGLGAEAVQITDCNDALTNGWYRWGEQILNAPFNYGTMLVMTQSGTECITQIAFRVDTGTQYAIRTKDHAFGAWAYQTPPMTIGVEYRTTERYMDKPVYVKLVNFGALPNNTTKTVSIGASVAVVAPKVDLSDSVISNYSDGMPGGNLLPIFTDWINKIDVSGSGGGKIEVVTSSDMSDYYGFFCVKYCKAAD